MKKNKSPYPMTCKYCKYIYSEKINGTYHIRCEKHSKDCAYIKECKDFKHRTTLISSPQDLATLLEIIFAFTMLVLLILHMVGVIDINTLLNNK